MMSLRSSIILIFLSLIVNNEALKILVFFPLSSKSHSILGHGFVNNLLEAGHEVVHITAYPSGKPVKNLREVSFENMFERARRENPELFEDFKLKNQVGQKKDFGDSIVFLYFAYDIHRQILQEKNVVELLGDPKEKFDAVIVEWFFADLVAGIAPLFECPLIWVGSTEAHWQVLKLVDEIPNPSYNMDIFSESSTPLTFWERVVELWTLTKKYLIINLIVVPFETLLYNKVFQELAAKRGVTMPSYKDAVYNGSLMFLNSHPSIGTPYRLPQNAKYIAGYHVENKVKPLPKDLQKIMDEAKHGVIYFSMGSNLQSEDMSTEMKESLFKMFGKLKETVIWKFETDIKNIPSNVHVIKWAPQQSILSHPNLKMFISHGGQLSTIEAIHHAVPVIGLPVMGDQHMNMRSITRKGFAITVKLSDDIADRLYVAIQEMLTNSTYKSKAKEVSAMYHDRPVPPGKELVHWVEHVVRTRGAPHLRSPALHVPLYQKLYLDLISILVIVTTLLIVIIKRIRNRKSTKKSKTERKEKRH